MTVRVVLLLCLVTCTPAVAQLPAARLATVFPPGGKAGTSVDVTLAGQDLDAATELRFSHSGITGKKTGGGSAVEATFTVAIAADVPVGTHDCRVVGRFGISNPRAFVVGDREAANGAKPGDAPSNAGRLPPNAVASARCAANAYDHWAFEARAGQRLTIECAAREIDSRLVPSLAVFDAAGRELDRSRRTGLIDFTPPADGTYTLRVSDALYRGGPDYFYRLSAHTAPRIDHVFPPVGRPGTKATYTLVGRNLPGGRPSPLVAADGKPLEEATVEVELPTDPPPHQQLRAAVPVPAAVGLDGFAYRLRTDAGTSNAVPILFAGAEVTTESDSVPAAVRNDKPANAQPLTLPAEVAGRLHPRGDRDWYVFDARKGDVYYVEITSDRLGLPTAPAAVIQRVTDGDRGEPKAADVLESPDDDATPGSPAFRTATRDFALRWDVKEDGRYRLLVRDRFGPSRDDPSLVYWLSVRRAAPDFRVVASPVPVAPAETTVWSPLLRKGGSTPLRVALFRTDGFDGRVTVSAEGLPPGFTAEPLTLGGAESAGVLILTAAEDAASWAGPIRVVATAAVGDNEITREARGGTVVWGAAADGKAAAAAADPVVARLTADVVLGVCGAEAEPVVITAADGKPVEVQAGGKVSIPLKVKRNAEVKAALKLKPAGLDVLKAVKEVTVDPKADAAKLDLDLGSVKLPPGTYTFYLASPAQVKYARPAGDAGAAGGKDTGKEKAEAAKDVSAVVVSGPITLKVLAAVAGRDESDGRAAGKQK